MSGDGSTQTPWDVWREPTETRAGAIAELTAQVEATEPFAGAVWLLNAGGKCPATTGCGPASEANATRIVTCVNACDGIPNVALNAGVIGKLVEEAAVAVEELDYLVGFVRRQCEFEGDIDAAMLAVKSLRAALALAKGEVA